MEKFCWVYDVGLWKICGYDFGYVGIFAVGHGHGHVGIFSNGVVMGTIWSLCMDMSKILVVVKFGGALIFCCGTLTFLGA